MRAWARRAAELHHELRELAEIDRDPRWWLVAGGAAVPWTQRAAYVVSDAEPASDTFIGYVPDAPFADGRSSDGRLADEVRVRIWDAIARAHAARDALRVLDGQLPDQPLAVTVRRTALGAIVESSALDVAAFAIGDRCWCATLAPALAGEHDLADELARIAALRATGDQVAGAKGSALHRLRALGGGPVPFVAVTLGDEPIETARHGHRRAWIGNGTGAGPWLGLSHAGGLAIVSTCHMVVDGFGHAWLSAEIRTRARALLSGIRTNLASGTGTYGASGLAVPASRPVIDARPLAIPPPCPVAGASPLAIAWQKLDEPAPRALPLAYALGRVLHRVAGRPTARFSPTFQIPVAPGVAGDPDRRRRRVRPAIASVRFDGGTAEPYETFEARTRACLEREANGSGLSARLLAAAQSAPAPLAWKRRAVGPARPRWLDAVATLIGGRGCVSRIRVDLPGVEVPAACAVSSPARLATPDDPLGGCVVTVLDDGRHAAITLCGVGFVTGAGAEDVLRQLLAELPARRS